MPAGRLHRGKPVPDDALKTEKRHLVEATRELAEIDLMSSLPRITAPTVATPLGSPPQSHVRA
jgi:hypothetical protein